MNRFLTFCIRNKLIVGLLTTVILLAGLAVSPFAWNLGILPRNAVPVDAIPDIGENQQIVFTNWNGRSPQDIEDQITYPLTTTLLGLPGVKTIRSTSLFGFSSIYVIFRDDVDFYWARSRILEKLNSLPKGQLPDGVQPQLGPDATGLGQVFWYTLEGQIATEAAAKAPAPAAFSLQELRSTQDWQVRYALQSVEGVAEVASIGGYVKEYQIDVDPDALRVYGISLQDVYRAVQRSNGDVGARTLEINSVEYIVRGIGSVASLDDLRKTAIRTEGTVPITLDQVATLSIGPAPRRGILDKAGAEAVGGVVTVRYGENPLEVIERVKAKIAEIAPALPRTQLADGREAQVAIVPFYDRTQLIRETLTTLEDAVRQQILITGIVVLLLVFRLRSSLLISITLPVAVLGCFIAMKVFGVSANIVALSGIAIAIGTIVDLGIVLVENIQRHLDANSDSKKSRFEIVRQASREVSGPITTAIATTLISFLPVFALQGQAYKLFSPLAYTKTFSLVAALLVTLVLIPPLAHLMLRRRKPLPSQKKHLWICIVAAAAAALLLASDWKPVAPDATFSNILFVFGWVAVVIVGVTVFKKRYARILGAILRFKIPFILSCAALTFFGLTVGLGVPRLLAFAPAAIKDSTFAQDLSHRFPGLQSEFMPELDEGSFLFMPTTMTHASIGEALDVLQKQDIAIAAIPEVASAVGKLGRVDSPLDPAPISMIETVVSYKPEYVRDAEGKLVRQWRDHIQSPEDIWEEITAAARIPGTTSAPRLQPIAARLVMLQSGVRAPMALQISGTDLASIEAAAIEIGELLKQVPSINPDTVFADRIVGKPYLEIEIDRVAISRHGLQIQAVLDTIEIAIGGKTVSYVIDGRERHAIRVRHARERRDNLPAIRALPVATAAGYPVPLRELARIEYRRGPQAIKSENTSLVGYVIFDKKAGYSNAAAVEAATQLIETKIADGSFTLPPGVARPVPIGDYQNQLRTQERLLVVVPLSLVVILVILYLQFRKWLLSLIVFSGIALAWSGGFALLWLYGKEGFLNLDVLGIHLRDIFQVHPIHLSVAVWIGFLALFGIATDDGVLMTTYLEQRFRDAPPRSIAQIRQAVIEAAERRVRPALMTSATTLLALLPVLTSQGRGSSIMIPMAIPIFGGMLFALLSLLLVPTLYCLIAERHKHN